MPFIHSHYDDDSCPTLRKLDQHIVFLFLLDPVRLLAVLIRALSSPSEKAMNLSLSLFLSAHHII